MWWHGRGWHRLNSLPQGKLRLDKGEKAVQDRLIRSLEDKVGTLASFMERMKLAEYVELLNNPWRLFWVNFIAGLARGVGIAIGGTLLVALLLYLLSQIAVLNLPLISDFIAEIVRLVQAQLAR